MYTEITGVHRVQNKEREKMDAPIKSAVQITCNLREALIEAFYKVRIRRKAVFYFLPNSFRFELDFGEQS